jgi:hypothetical protein
LVTATKALITAVQASILTVYSITTLLCNAQVQQVRSNSSGAPPAEKKTEKEKMKEKLAKKV